MCVDMIKITQILITKRNMVYKCPQLHEKLCLCIYIYMHTHIYIYIYVQGVFQKYTQEHKELLILVISGPWNRVCGMEKRLTFHCISSVLFEFAFHMHENIIFVITKSKKPT